MFAASQGTHSPPVVTRPCSGTGSAGALARAYLDYVSAYWRGDAPASQMGDQLATFFGADMPVEPVRQADAFSPHGARGHGIRWYECGDAVVGYVPGATSGYRIPQACVAELCSAATGVALCGSTSHDSPPRGKADQRDTSELHVQESVAHVVFPHSRTAVDAVA